MKWSKFLVLFTAITISVFSTGAVDVDQDTRRALEGISGQNALEYCKAMTSDKFAGRLTGQEGYTLAARWAAGKFNAWGLEPIDPKTGYLQAYPSPYTVVEKAEMILFEPGRKQGVSLAVGSDFLPLLYSDSGDNRAGLVFAGWGISAPELGYDDYAGVDVKGKFVLCFRGTPDRAKKEFEKYDYHHVRMKTAKLRGALGLFYFYPEPLANPNGKFQKNFTPAILSYGAADKVLKEKGKTAQVLKNELETGKTPQSFAMESEIRFKLTTHHDPGATGYNVAAYIPGSDPELKHECLVMGAHFDHCGKHAGILFPGANDNASGSAAVMEMARAFAAKKERPRRSVVFVLFGGEEMGLMGSHYFASHLPVPFEKVDAMFNFDMVGHGQDAFCVLSEKPAALKEALEQADIHIGTLKGTRLFRGVGPRSSDFKPFFQQGAACISFFSTGPHKHYHKPQDTVAYLDAPVMEKIAKLAFLTAFHWADR